MGTFPAWHQRGYGLYLQPLQRQRPVFVDPGRYFMGYLRLQTPEEKEANIQKLVDEYPTEENLEERLRNVISKEQGSDTLNYGWNTGVLRGVKWLDRGHSARLLTDSNNSNTKKQETNLRLKRAADEQIGWMPVSFYSTEGDFYGSTFKAADTLTAELAALDIALHLDERSGLNADHNMTGLTHKQRQPYSPDRVREPIPFRYFEQKERTEELMREFMFRRFIRGQEYGPIDKHLLSPQLLREGIALDPFVKEQLRAGWIRFGVLPHRQQQINEENLTENQQKHLGTIRQIERDLNDFLKRDRFARTGSYVRMFPDTSFETVGAAYLRQQRGKTELVTVGTPIARVKKNRLYALPPMVVYQELHDFAENWEDSSDPLPLIPPFNRPNIPFETVEDSTRRVATTRFILPHQTRKMSRELSQRGRELYARATKFLEDPKQYALFSSQLQSR